MDSLLGNASNDNAQWEIPICCANTGPDIDPGLFMKDIMSVRHAV